MNQKIDIKKSFNFTWAEQLKSVSDEGILEGTAIYFGSESEPDRSQFKDFFTSDTFIHPDNTFTTPLFFEHAMSYDRPIGKAVMFKSEKGWMATAQLDMSNPLVKARFPEVKAGGWGFSTGSAGHVVLREEKSNGTHHITQWPATEISLTKTPAEPKALIHSVKSLDEYYGGVDTLPDDEQIGDSNNTTIQILMEIITQLLEQISKKQIEQFLIPELNELKSQLKEMKESDELPIGSLNDEELTVLKSERDELTLKLSELQSSFDEKEALLSEKMALLSETQAELEAKSQDITTLEEALNLSQSDLEAKSTELDTLKEKVDTLTKSARALAKTNFNI